MVLPVITRTASINPFNVGEKNNPGQLLLQGTEDITFKGAQINVKGNADIQAGNTPVSYTHLTMERYTINTTR